MRREQLLLHFLAFSLLSSLAFADEHNHVYEDSDEVVLWMSTVGPYHNRQETYSYYSLPFCTGTKNVINHYHETLSEALQGIELKFSGLEIEFKEDISKTEYCQISLNEESQKAFVYAIKNQYWYQMYIDDLPIWGVVGELENNDGVAVSDSYFIWTHKKFDIGYNGKQIVDVNLTSENKVKLVQGARIPFSYEVNWKKSNIKFEDRFDKYLDPNFFQHRIHWFSIFNSFMMVIFLVGLVSMILMRTLRKDYARYSRDEEMDDMERDLGDEYGWKQVHGDVFRPASHAMLFSALIGAGYQVTVVVLSVIIFAILGELYTERGSMLSTAIFVYAATSPINGYAGGGLYARMGGRVWIKQMVLSAFMLPLMVCGTAFFINFIAMYYHASRAIPFGSMVRSSLNSIVSINLHETIFVILMIVTVCVTIVCTYFLLNAEDYRWQWTSFLAAASTAGYVYIYSFYYFFFKTKMYGLFQTAFYFGYMALFSLALGIMCGTVGYIGTNAFVRKIYSTVKID
ncbi:transmembrane 9 superfamily member 3 [Lasius niger]|uniref:Transmembrane 9 superfamily member n=1 Tax=Lasius niger TaxID=67767 RepID=A0A0J7NKK8_LASNI|nr:transmembrane 9 superfamily member 3 [Lasius niger]